MRINAKEHMALSTKFADPENGFFEVFICPELQTLRCGGIEIIGKQMKKKAILIINKANV